MTHRRLLAGALIGVVGFVTPLIASRGAEVAVFAAASLTDALKQAASAYEKASGDKIVFNFAASSLLARQIEEGAPADIFFSADEARMNALENRGLILRDTRRSRLSNSLVVVVPADSDVKVAAAADLAGSKIKRFALADPQVVPAGVYAKTFLEKEKLWSALEPKVVGTENVRAALAAVESGNVDAAMVFKTDAAISRKVRVALEIPAVNGPKISYPMAVVNGSKQVEAAKRFLQYLASDDAGKIFESYGFVVLK